MKNEGVIRGGMLTDKIINMPKILRLNILMW